MQRSSQSSYTGETKPAACMCSPMPAATRSTGLLVFLGTNSPCSKNQDLTSVRTGRSTSATLNQQRAKEHSPPQCCHMNRVQLTYTMHPCSFPSQAAGLCSRTAKPASNTVFGKQLCLVIHLNAPEQERLSRHHVLVQPARRQARLLDGDGEGAAAGCTGMASRALGVIVDCVWLAA